MTAQTEDEQVLVIWWSLTEREDENVDESLLQRRRRHRCAVSQCQWGLAEHKAWSCVVSKPLCQKGNCDFKVVSCDILESTIQWANVSFTVHLASESVKVAHVYWENLAWSLQIWLRVHHKFSFTEKNWYLNQVNKGGPRHNHEEGEFSKKVFPFMFQLEVFEDKWYPIVLVFLVFVS